MAFLALIIFVIVLLIWFAPKTRTPVTIISNPVVGVLNLIGPSADADVKDDLEQLTEVFSEVRRQDDVSPFCDVLLLYCKIDSSGVIKGSSQSLREIMRDAGAAVVVVATNNESKHYNAGLEKFPVGVNFIMTIDRREYRFARCLGKLFAQMKRGVSMPIAWVNIAPQVPGPEHDELPAWICALGAGHIAFS
jgi:hypothetical protein